MSGFDKSRVRNLPAHAQIQAIRGTIYVYFAYCFSINGKRKQERDYIGTVDTESMKFVPNGFFLREKPSFQQRALSRWKDPDKKKREEGKRSFKEVRKNTFLPQLADYIPQSAFINQLDNAQDQLLKLIQKLSPSTQIDNIAPVNSQEDNEQKTLNDELDQINRSFESVLLNFKPVLDKLDSSEESDDSSKLDALFGKERLKKHSDQLTAYLAFQLFDQMSRNLDMTQIVLRKSQIKSPATEEIMTCLRTLSEKFRSIHNDMERRFDIEGIYNGLIASQYLNAPRTE